MFDKTVKDLETVIVLMRGDSGAARAAKIAATIACAPHKGAKTFDEACALARDMLKGKPVELEHLENGIQMASWSTPRKESRLSTIRKNAFA